jgi:hypothetical protein
MDFLSFVIGLCLTWILIQVAFYMIPSSRKWKANHKKLPPGPKPFPVIGNLLELGDQPHRSLTRLAKAHGPIMTLQLGGVTTIVISSADTAKEVLQTHDQLLSNRTIPDALRAHDTTSSACHGYPFQASGETFAKYAMANYSPTQHLMPTKISGERKCKSSSPRLEKATYPVKLWKSAERLSRLRSICYQTPCFRWIWRTRILFQSSRRSCGISWKRLGSPT